MSRISRESAAAAAAFAVCLLIYLVLLSEGSFVPWGGGLRSTAYDSLAASILSGRADVAGEAIDWEGYEIGGRHYMYFGPWPAILRIPLTTLAGAGSYGQWARLSCLSALLGAVWLGAAIAGLSARSILAMALGTPLLYLAASTRIYHEAIAWGVAWELGALFAFFRTASAPNRAARWLLTLSTCAALALLSRVTCGVGAYTLLLVAICRCRRTVATRAIVAAAIPAALGAGAQLLYNYSRFGSLLAFDHQSYVDVASLGGTFNPERIPSTLYNYLAPRPGLFSSEWPFVRLLQPHYFRPELFFSWREEILPLSIGSAWLVLAASRNLFTRRSERHLAFLSLLPQAAIILCYYFVTERYAIELALPLLALASGDGTRPRASAGVTVAFSCAVTIWFTMLWIAFGVGETGLSAEHKGRVALALIGRLSPEGRHSPVEADDILAIERDPGVRAFVTDSERDNGGPTFHGVMLDRSIIMEANSVAVLSVPPGAERFEAVAGFVDMRPRCSQGSARLLVLEGGGVVAYDSGEIRQSDMPRRISVTAKEGETLSLVVDGAGSRSMCDLVVWAYPSWARGRPRNEESSNR